MPDETYAIVDVETTGASAAVGRVIEIGVLRVEKGEVVKTYKSLIDPEQPIPEFITGMTGIGDADVAAAPTFAAIADDVLELFANATFVAHNAAFDYAFLKAEFRRLGYAFTLPRLCTVRLSRAVHPEHRHHNLSALIERHGFAIESRHRAFDDAQVLWQFLQLLRQTVPEDELRAHIDRSTSKVYAPPADAVHSFVYERDMEHEA